MSEILLTFNADGLVSMEVFGCEGPECIEKTRDLEAALGRPKTRSLKAEFKKEKITGKRIVSGK